MGLWRKVLVLAGAAAAVGIAYWSRLPSDLELRESLLGKKVVITGASRGIGEQLAYVACENGASVLLTARTASLLEKVAERCRGLGGAWVGVQAADMGKERDVLELYQAIRAAFPTIDHVVLNHAWLAHANQWTGSAQNVTLLSRMHDINFHSYVQLASLAQPMLEASGGRLTVVSSVMGQITLPYYASYASTKFALQGFFASLQHELAMRQSDFTVTLAVIGRIATAATERQLELTKAAKYVRHGKLDDGEDPYLTALTILKGSAGRWREVYYPRWAAILRSATSFPLLRPFLNRLTAYVTEREA